MIYICIFDSIIIGAFFLCSGCGYHLDLMVLSVLILIVGALGLPIYVAATVLSINHVNSLKMESQSRAPGEVAQFIGVR